MSIKNDLFRSFIPGGINTFTSLSYINNAIMIARDITLSPEYSPRNLLRFIYCFHTQPSSFIFEEYQNTNSDSDEENIQLNIAVQHSLADNFVNFIPSDKFTVDSISVDVFLGNKIVANSFESTQCVICLDNYVTGAEIVKLEFDRSN